MYGNSPKLILVSSNYSAKLPAAISKKYMAYYSTQLAINKGNLSNNVITFVGFSLRFGGFLLGVNSIVNCKRLHDQMVSTIMHKNLFVLTFSS